MVGHIQAPMDRGVVFHKLVEQGKLHKKTVAHPIGGTDENLDHKLLIKAADIARIFEFAASSSPPR
jgi:hypothetical protein